MPRRHSQVAPENGTLRRNTKNEIRSSSNLSVHIDDSDVPRIHGDEIDENDFPHYAIHTLQLEDAYVEELVVEHAPVQAISTWKKPVGMPRWLLLLLSNAFILLLIVTFSVVFSYKQAKVGIGESCFTDSDCNSYVGLKCTDGTCSCSTVQIWNGLQCIPQRTYNRSCISQSQCNSVAKLLCMSVTIGTTTDSLCWCSSYRYWTGDQCAFLKTINQTCAASRECDNYSFLTCLAGRCDCIPTQFWNNVYCENKRTYGQQCFTNSWCDNTTAGLVCSTWAPTTGTCDCAGNQYWSSTNTTCIPQLPLNSNCSYSYQCITNQSLICSNTTTPSSCQCSTRSWYNSTQCVSRFLANSTCTSSVQCDSTLLLTCNSTAQKCSCNESSYLWDGTQCVIRRTIGGACTSNSQCLAYQNLTCATSGVWNGTCACPTNYYWNNASSVCVLKKLWNYTCANAYECYDGGGLTCQFNATLGTSTCDCGNYTYYWTGFMSNTYSGYCTPKIGYNVPTFICSSSYQCQDYNLLACISSQCQCTSTYYWSTVSNSCQPKKSINGTCASSTECLTTSGLSCTGGYCQCSASYTWNSGSQSCVSVG